jgi:hypothetical protein
MMKLVSWGEPDDQGEDTYSELIVSLKNRNVFFNGEAYNSVDSPINSIVAGTWYHVLFTFDGNKGFLYLNGTLAQSKIINLSTHNTEIKLGLNPDHGGVGGWNSPFDGLIDEVMVSDQFMNSSEVKDFYLSYNDSQDDIPSVSVTLSPSAYKPDQKASMKIEIENSSLDYDTLSVEMKYSIIDGIPNYVGNFTCPRMDAFALNFDIPSDIEDGTYVLEVKVCGFQSGSFVWSDSDLTSFKIEGDNLHEGLDELDYSLDLVWNDIKEILKWNETFEELIRRTDK